MADSRSARRPRSLFRLCADFDSFKRIVIRGLAARVMGPLVALVLAMTKFFTLF
jgi:hypothetical protein